MGWMEEGSPDKGTQKAEDVLGERLSSVLEMFVSCPSGADSYLGLESRGKL
jgi:hypothetical protein